MKYKYDALLAFMYMAKIRCKNFHLTSVEIAITKEEVEHQEAETRQLFVKITYETKSLKV